VSAPRAETEELDRGTLRTRFASDDGELSRAEVLAALQDDAAFRGRFRESLAASPFGALFWETPAWTRANLARPYEHVVRDAPALAGVAAEEAPFRTHVEGRRGVTTFTNLGGDAELVVPCAEVRLDVYPHLAAFVRAAPTPQVDALLVTTVRVLRARLADGLEPTWVSTSGLGVAWVHVRLDSVPKYYTHRPYRDPAG